MFNQYVLSSHDPLQGMRNCLVLDSGSSTHLFCRQDWLANLRALQEALALSTNGGPMQITQQGDLPGLGPVPFDPKSLTNILALGLLAEKYRVVMDSAVENAFTVFTEHGPVKFICNDQKLYVHVPTRLPKDSGVSSVGGQCHRGYVYLWLWIIIISAAENM